MRTFVISVFNARTICVIYNQKNYTVYIEKI